MLWSAAWSARSTATATTTPSSRRSAGSSSTRPALPSIKWEQRVATTVDRPPSAPLNEPAERFASEPLEAFQRPFRLPPLTIEHLAWIGLVAIAFVMRIWDVGKRAMHHDESMHAFYGWTLFKGGGY